MGKQITVLYVEDDPRDQELTLRQLGRDASHLKILVAGSQKEATMLLEEKSFDLVLVDYHLPDGDGISLISWIQERGISSATVVVTGHGDEQTALAALKAGAEDYIAKRAGYLDQLPTIIENTLNRFRERKEFRAKPLRLLYGDDNETDVDLTRRYLKQHAPHIHLEVASTGQGCLARLEEESFDAFLVDYRIPDKSGLELLKEIAARNLILPVIMVTGQGEEDVAVQSIKLGASDYIIKTGEYIQRLSYAIEQAVAQFRLKESEKTLQKREEERKQAEAALQEKERFQEKLLNDMMTFISVLEPSGNVIFVNNTPLKVGGFKLEDVIGKKFFDAPWWTHSDEVRNTIIRDIEQCSSGETMVHDVQIQTADGSLMWIEYNMHPIFDEHGVVQYLIPEGRDITERKQYEEKLKTSETFLKAIVENIPNMIFVKDAKDLRFVRFNKAGEDLIGYSRKELIGKHDFEFFPKKEADFFTKTDREVLDKGTFFDIPEEPIQTKYKGKRILHTKKIPLLDEKGQPEYLLGISEDITESKRLEEQLQQAQKMESIGTLAGGIAHDFNNVLYSIIGYTELTMDDVPEGSLAQKNLKEIFKGAMRAKDMVQQILAFSRKTDTEKKPIKAQSVVKEALKLLRTSIPSTIEIRQNIDADCSPVLADATQIHQVVINLATNAYQAMQEKGGVLELTLMEEEIGSDDSDLNLAPGTYLKLTVSDTGHGMDKAVIEKIYDPYFSTKGPGEGTGMGLSVIHGIVRSHGGDIKVYSELGEGTVFHIYLPLIETRPVEPKTITEEAVSTGTEHILLVDDEECIVLMAQQMLERLGYQVTSRTSSMKALEAFKAKPNAFDLVITDMTMPNMTGLELAPRLKEIRPDIPIIICTGFSEMIDKNKAKNMGILAYIMKPILKDEMAGTIRKLLDDGKEK